jgi:CheY-like chemotaxis protein
MNLTVVAHLLRSLGCSATTLADPAVMPTTLAAAEASGAPIDLVLLDIHLERASGLDVCRRLRQSGVDLPVLCMSGDTVAPRTYTEAGFDGVIEKPLDHEILRSCVTRYAGWSHARSSPRTETESRPPVAAGA